MILNADQIPLDRPYFCALADSRQEIFLTLGACSYIGELDCNFVTDDGSSHHVLIGRFSSLADKITFMIGLNHPYKTVSSYPFDVDSVCKKIFGNANQEPLSLTRPNHFQVIIGHDVWIGRGATIMSGVKIGNGAIIGTGAVVAKNIPPYAIAVGNPARVIKYRFDEETIKKLLAVKWWNWSLEKIADNMPLMNDVEKFLETHYSPDLEKPLEDYFSRRINTGGGFVFINSLQTFALNSRCGRKLCAIFVNRIVKMLCS